MAQSVLHAQVATFLCTQDKPNSFPSPQSLDLNKGITVVPLHEVLQAVKQLRWKAWAEGSWHCGQSRKFGPSSV